MKWVLIAVIIYFIGMFITKIVVTIHDHCVLIHFRIDDFDVVVMLVWFIFLPLLLLGWGFCALYDKCENIGEWICRQLKR